MSAQDPFAPQPSQEWLTPASLPPSPYDPPPAAKSPAMFELRPLTLSEVLDRTFALFRSRFWLFAGISAVAGAVQALVTAGQLLTQGRMMGQIFANIGNPGSPAPAPYVPGASDFLGSLLVFIGSLIYILAFSITTSATVFAVGETYLGRTVSVKESFAATIRRWYRYIAIAIWQAASFGWLLMVVLIPGFVLIGVRSLGLGWLGGLLLFIGIPGALVGGVILLLRNMLAVPACVTERLAIRASMRRSKVLSGGSKGRVFVLYLISLALYMVVGVLQTPFTMAAMFTMAKMHGVLPYILQAVVLVITFVGHTVVSPVMAIGLVLIYFDQRVRKEAFDIAVLMGEERALEYGAPTVQASAAQVAAMAPYSPEAWAQSQGYSPQGYPAQGYPVQEYAAQENVAQGYSTPGYSAPSYPPPPYPPAAQGEPTVAEGYPSASVESPAVPEGSSTAAAEGSNHVHGGDGSAL